VVRILLPFSNLILSYVSCLVVFDSNEKKYEKPGAIFLWLGSADNDGVKVGLLEVGRSDKLPPDLEVSTKDLPRSVFEGVLSTAGCELGPVFCKLKMYFEFLNENCWQSF
jgi:hypothetical protein